MLLLEKEEIRIEYDTRPHLDTVETQNVMFSNHFTLNLKFISVEGMLSTIWAKTGK